MYSVIQCFCFILLCTNFPSFPFSLNRISRNFVYHLYTFYFFVFCFIFKENDITKTLNNTQPTKRRRQMDGTDRPTDKHHGIAHSLNLPAWACTNASKKQQQQKATTIVIRTVVVSSAAAVVVFVVFDFCLICIFSNLDFLGSRNKRIQFTNNQFLFSFKYCSIPLLLFLVFV